MKEDKELQEYRDLLKPPTHFEEGFDWKTVVGAVFIGFLMMPGSMYLQLVIGTGIGPAARWVTIILFAELARRSYSGMKQQEIFLLYYMAGAAMHTPFQGLLWNQYLVQSDAARMLGLTEFIPLWVAPSPESSALLERTFFHRDWLIPILLLIGTQIITRIDQFGLGYALYRITSDVEKLPFPMAPVAALGTMALAETTEEREKSWKWRVFSIGGVIGLAFGGVYVLLPAVSGLFLTEPIRLIPIPWVELTLQTEDWLPAVATGIQLDLGLVFIGMVLPFWAVIGGLVGLIITVVANPILYHHGILNRWHPGMRTVETVFANSFDFYLSFSIGLGLGHCRDRLLARGALLPAQRGGGTRQLAGPLPAAAGTGGLQFLDLDRDLRLFDPLLRAAVRVAGPEFSGRLLSDLRVHLHPGHLLRHGPHGRHRRPVREPAAGAGGQLHRRGEILRLPGDRDLVRADSHPQLRQAPPWVSGRSS